MEMSVSFGENVGVGPESAPNPAGVAAREEYAKIMSDPQNPHNAGYLRRDPKVEAHVDGLYKRAYPGSGDEDRAGTTGGPKDERDPERVAQLEADAAIQNALGDTYEADLADVEQELRYLTSDEQGQQAYQVFAPRISELGPQGEVLTVKFLRDLRKLRKGG